MTPTQKKIFRNYITAFCKEAEDNRLKWHYSQVRPFGGFGSPASSWHVADCSAYCSLAFYWAVHHSNIWATDPLYERYTGWGNTGTALAFLKAHEAPIGKYLVGDMPIMGTSDHTVHMAICRKSGDANTAIFSNNGHESFNFPSDAPNPMSLNQMKVLQSLVGVYRHPALL